MKALLRFVLAAAVALTAVGAHAQRVFSQPELEALLAPIALYPDPLLSQVLDAARYPQDVAAAAAWSRGNPQLAGDAALATVQNTPWPPSVKALVASPEVLQRMAESPQWLSDLGEAYATDAPSVMATVQDLRARAQASGYLQSNNQQSVYQQGNVIVVQPAYPNVVYVPYYDPYVVYGVGAWTVVRPVVFRPWIVRPLFVTRVVVVPPVRWYVHSRVAPVVIHAPVVVVHAPPAVHAQRFAPPRIVQGGPVLRPFRPVPESRRPPFVHSGGPAFIHSSGPALVHSSSPAVVHGAPQTGGHGHGGHRSGRR